MSETNIVVIYDQIPQQDRFGTLLPFPPRDQTRDDEEEENETNERREHVSLKGD